MIGHILAVSGGTPLPTTIAHAGSHVLAFTEKFAKIIGLVIIFGLMLWRGVPMFWAIICSVLLGVFIIPSFSPSISQAVAKVNHGSAIGTTGASAGELALLVVLVGVTIFLVMKSN
jgi:hypothetical protein